MIKIDESLAQEQVIAQYTAAVQSHLDAFAQTRNYDGILSAATYATSTVPKFQVEGQYAVEARDTDVGGVLHDSGGRSRWGTGHANTG